MQSIAPLPIELEIENVEVLIERYYWSFLVVAGVVVVYYLVLGIRGLMEIRRKED